MPAPSGRSPTWTTPGSWTRSDYRAGKRSGEALAAPPVRPGPRSDSGRPRRATGCPLMRGDGYGLAETLDHVDGREVDEYAVVRDQAVVAGAPDRYGDDADILAVEPPVGH